MFKSLSAFTLSAAIAIGTMGATASPARANDDIGKFIIGAIALGIIANGIRQAQSNTGSSTTTTTTTLTPTVRPNPHRPHPHRPHPPALTIPASCERQVVINHHYRNVFGAPCLMRSGVPVQRLSACAQQGSIAGRNLTYYTRLCLSQQGFRIS